MALITYPSSLLTWWLRAAGRCPWRRCLRRMDLPSLCLAYPESRSSHAPASPPQVGLQQIGTTFSPLFLGVVRKNGNGMRHSSSDWMLQWTVLTHATCVFLHPRQKSSEQQWLSAFLPNGRNELYIELGVHNPAKFFLIKKRCMKYTVVMVPGECFSFCESWLLLPSYRVGFAVRFQQQL